MNSEAFNYAYSSIENRQPFAITDEDGDVFRGGPGLDSSSFDGLKWHPGVAIDFMRIEYEHKTLEYVFFINGVPLAFYGAFGLLRIPPDEYDELPPKRDRYNQFIDDLADPLANHDTA